MKTFELTEKSKSTDWGEVYQIRALVDILRRNVKKGDLGGYLSTDSTLEGDTWAEPGTIVFNSHLSGSVHVSSEAEIINSKLSGKCEIMNFAKLKDMEGNGILASGNSTLTYCKLESKFNDRISFFIGDYASIENSALTYAGDLFDKILLKDNASLMGCEVKGCDIQFMGNTELNQSKVSGEKILFKDTANVRKLDLTGDDLEFKGVKKLHNLTGEAKQVSIRGGVTIEDVEMKAENVDIFGKEVHIEKVKLDANKIRIRDNAVVKEVDITGDDVLISDYVSLVGRKEERISILEKTTIQELVRIELGEGKKLGAIANTSLSGDLLITGY